VYPLPPGLSVAVCGGDDDHGAVGVVGDLAADRSKQQSAEPAGAPRADDQHVGVPARGDEDLRGEAADPLDRDRLRAWYAELGQRLVDFLATGCTLITVSGAGRIAASTTAARANPAAKEVRSDQSREPLFTMPVRAALASRRCR
jgi:hypothetical protein